MSKQQLYEIWSSRVAEFKASGQSVAAWCAEQDLKPHQLRYWLRKRRESRNPTEWLKTDFLADVQIYSKSYSKTRKP